MLSQEIIMKYQETISLLQLKNPKYSYYGEFVRDDNKIAYKLICINHEENKNLIKVFKFMDNDEKALKYFIKSAQNRVF